MVLLLAPFSMREESKVGGDSSSKEEGKRKVKWAGWLAVGSRDALRWMD